MEIKDELQIEIFHTLEKIKQINVVIHTHEKQEEPDKLAIEQYLDVKHKLALQLVELLKGVELSVLLAA